MVRLELKSTLEVEIAIYIVLLQIQRLVQKINAHFDELNDLVKAL